MGGKCCSERKDPDRRPDNAASGSTTATNGGGATPSLRLETVDERESTPHPAKHIEDLSAYIDTGEKHVEDLTAHIDTAAPVFQKEAEGADDATAKEEAAKHVAEMRAQSEERARERSDTHARASAVQGTAETLQQQGNACPSEDAKAHVDEISAAQQRMSAKLLEVHSQVEGDGDANAQEEAAKHIEEMRAGMEVRARERAETHARTDAALATAGTLQEPGSTACPSEDAKSHADEIGAAKQRMEAKMLAAEQEVAAQQIQAIHRGNLDRKAVEKKKEAEKSEQSF